MEYIEATMYMRARLFWDGHRQVEVCREPASSRPAASLTGVLLYDEHCKFDVVDNDALEYSLLYYDYGRGERLEAEHAPVLACARAQHKVNIELGYERELVRGCCVQLWEVQAVGLVWPGKVKENVLCWSSFWLKFWRMALSRSNQEEL